MGRPRGNGRAALPKRKPRAPAAKHQRKQRLLTQATPALVPSIADALVIKDGAVFFLCSRDGDVPVEGNHGLGLYFHDCCYLNGYELRIAGARPNALAATAARGYCALLQLTNPEIRTPNGTVLPKENLDIKWERVIDAEKLALDESLIFRNYADQPVEFEVSLTFRADFEDVFCVRGLLPEKHGTAAKPRWDASDALQFLYHGSDGLYRRTEIEFQPTPARAKGTTAHFHIALPPQGIEELEISIQLAESPDRVALQAAVHHRPDRANLAAVMQRLDEQWLQMKARFHSDSLLLDGILNRAVHDLRILRSNLGNERYFAAGVPWFVTLFGRDSALTAYFVLAFAPNLAAETLRLLARYQGTKVDDWRDEEPGKILHELRVGELARTGQIPHTPYYGSIDATPLFLILLAAHATWTGSLQLFHELRDNVERALVWIADYGDSDGDGYLEYVSQADRGLVNQGWKDSGDAIVNADGTLARPPIALVEVQAYVYQAKQMLAELFERAGEPTRGEQLQKEAAELRQRFNRDFWLEGKGYYALALQRDKVPAAVLSSNPGHALWSGIADHDKAARLADKLMCADMFSGWGIRTLSQSEVRYNPISYHRGTVWPHDNALVAAGLRRYDLDEHARRVMQGILDAAINFEAYRMPELFTGFSRAEYQVPVPYPVACHPQAWAAGAVLSLVQTALGLVPDAFQRRLRIVRPMLPQFVNRLCVDRLRVGGAAVDLCFERVADGSVSTKVIQVVDGPLDVVIEPAPAARKLGERRGVSG